MASKQMLKTICKCRRIFSLSLRFCFFTLHAEWAWKLSLIVKLKFISFRTKRKKKTKHIPTRRWCSERAHCFILPKRVILSVARCSDIITLISLFIENYRKLNTKFSKKDYIAPFSHWVRIFQWMRVDSQLKKALLRNSLPMRVYRYSVTRSTRGIYEWIN